MRTLRVIFLSALAPCLFTTLVRADTMYTYYLIDNNGQQDGSVQFSISPSPPSTGSVRCANVISAYYPLPGHWTNVYSYKVSLGFHSGSK